MDFYQELYFHGKRYDGQALLTKAQTVLESSKTSSWEKSIWSFISDWVSDGERVVIQSSGTTGESQRQRVHKEKMIRSAQKTGKALDLRSGNKACMCLPADFIAGKMMIVRAFVLGLDLYSYPPDQQPLKNFRRMPAMDFIALVPVQLRSILESDQEARQRYFESINTVIVGGGALDPDLVDMCQQYSNRIFATYGMTETLTHIALQRINGNRPDRAFVALPDVSLSTDEENCLIIHAPWLRPTPIFTHDVVELVSDNRFRWLGRSDFVINSGGINIHPEQVEQALSSIISNRSYFITGIPDKRWGEIVTLVLEGEPLPKHEERQLRETMAHTISSSHRPRSIIYCPQFHRTNSGKIKRQETLSTVKPV